MEMLIDKRDLELWVEDVAVVSTYILLAAEYYGAAACWIHMKDQRGHTNMAEEDIRNLLGIPSYYGILNAVSLGIPKAKGTEGASSKMPLRNLWMQEKEGSFK